MKKSILYIFTMTALARCLIASKPPTNVELLVMSIDSAWSENLQSADFDTLSVYSIEGVSGADPVNQLVSGRLAAYLHRNHIPFTLVPDSTASRSVVLTILDAGVRYTRSGREGLLGKKWMEREALFHINLQVSNRGLFILNRDIQVSHRDRIPWNQLNYAEQRGIVIGFPDRPPFNDWLTRLETAMMIASVGVVILLFYIIRS